MSLYLQLLIIFFIVMMMEPPLVVSYQDQEVRLHGEIKKLRVFHLLRKLLDIKSAYIHGDLRITHVHVDILSLSIYLSVSTSINELMDGWMDGMDGWRDVEWMDGWMDGWMK